MTNLLVFGILPLIALSLITNSSQTVFLRISLSTTLFSLLKSSVLSSSTSKLSTLVFKPAKSVFDASIDASKTSSNLPRLHT